MPFGFKGRSQIGKEKDRAKDNIVHMEKPNIELEPDVFGGLPQFEDHSLQIPLPSPQPPLGEDNGVPVTQPQLSVSVDKENNQHPHAEVPSLPRCDSSGRGIDHSTPVLTKSPDAFSLGPPGNHEAIDQKSLEYDSFHHLLPLLITPTRLDAAGGSKLWAEEKVSMRFCIPADVLEK